MTYRDDEDEPRMTPEEQTERYLDEWYGLREQTYEGDNE